MDELNEQIDRLVDLLDVLKSRYFFLRAKYNIECNSQSIHASTDTLTEYHTANDLQYFVMLELYLLEYACTMGIYSMNIYATRLKTNLIANDKDHQFLKILKDNIRSFIGTNNEIKTISKDPYDSFHSYINSFLVYANVLKEMKIPNTIMFDEMETKKKKNKLNKRMLKINLMANVISYTVFEKIKDLRTKEGRAALELALKYRTPRNLAYYLSK